MKLKAEVDSKRGRDGNICLHFVFVLILELGVQMLKFQTQCSYEAENLCCLIASYTYFEWASYRVFFKSSCAGSCRKTWKQCQSSFLNWSEMIMANFEWNVSHFHHFRLKNLNGRNRSIICWLDLHKQWRQFYVSRT